jgi:DNA-binding NarL/FixJ family response regulator
MVAMSANELPRPVQKRIMVVDDHPMTRNGIAEWIRREQDLSVCAEAQNAEQALDAVSKSKPDLVLTDITLPGKSGLELIKDLRAIEPDLPVLVISMHDESLYAERALRAGARGYIMKHERGDEVMRAIRRVLSGKLYVSEEMSARILEGISGRQPATQCSAIKQLTDRELEVFQLIGQGLSTQQVATKLHLSAKTVDAHRASIKDKLEIKNLTELISYAARWSMQEGANAESDRSEA